jgi:hypothetical protein
MNVPLWDVGLDVIPMSKPRACAANEPNYWANLINSE